LVAVEILEQRMRNYQLLFAQLAAPLLSPGGTVLSTRPARQSAAPPAAVTLRIHWIDAHTGLPLPAIYFNVGFDFHRGKSTDGSPIIGGGKNLFFTTDQSGYKVITIPSPGPFFAIGGLFHPLKSPKVQELAGCSQSFFCTQDVIAHGANSENVCWPKKKAAPPPPNVHPGDLYLYAFRRSNFKVSLDGMFVSPNGISTKQGQLLEQIDEAARQKCPLPSGH
jgi:hypothetical protein